MRSRRMPEREEQRCPLCGAVCEAVDSETGTAVSAGIPAYRMGPVNNGRTFQVGGAYLLHHDCSSLQASTDAPYWDPDRAWWACKDPTRPLDEYAHFDLNCADCAVRWASRPNG